MNFSPRLDIAIVWIVFGLVAVGSIYGILGSKKIIGTVWRIPILLCRLLFIAILSLIFLNPVAKDEAKTAKAETLLLLDSSTSMSLGGSNNRFEQARKWATPLMEAHEMGFPPRLASFSDQFVLHEELESLVVSGNATNLGSALNGALDAVGREVPVVIVLVSDGQMSDRRELREALGRARKMGVKLITHTIGSDKPPRNAKIHFVDAPRSAHPESKVPVEVGLQFEGYLEEEELTLTITNEADQVIVTRKIKASSGGMNLKLFLTTGLRGQTYQVELSADPGEISIADNTASFAVEVEYPKLKVLFLEGTHHRRQVSNEKVDFYWNDMEFITRALESTGEIEVDSFTPLNQRADGPNLFYVRDYVDGRFQLDSSRGYPASRPDLFDYDVVIYSDVPVGNFNNEQMEAVVELVIERGGGFCMIGGFTSFDSGNYDRTPWERITPVDMVNYGHGYTVGEIDFKIPESVLNHPIWHILDDPVANQKLLSQHPSFAGYHDIARAKPGATLLGLRGDGGGPLLTVQNYGRGRSMAYLSDVNGGWGGEHMAWGAQKTASYIGAPQELGRGNVLLRRLYQSDREMNEEELVHPSPYYARFWINAVRWLGEKSIRQLQTDLHGKVESVALKPGEEVEVSAEVFAALPLEAIPELVVTASVSTQGAKSERLRWDRERREFTGRVQVPESVHGKVISVSFESQHDGERYFDEVPVSVLNLNPEFENTLPDRQLMSDLAQNSGGQTVSTSQEALTALRKIISQAMEAKTAYRTPQWDRWWVWLMVFALLAMEWYLRRMASVAKLL